MKISRRTGPRGPVFSLMPPVVYMGLVYALPILVFLVYSFWQVQGYQIVESWTLKNYADVLQNDVYMRLTLRSIGMALITASLTVLICYPLAYAMVFQMREGREIVLLLIIISLFTSYLVRVYAWKTILGSNGMINQVLIGLKIIAEPLPWLIYSKFAVIITLVSVFIPISILPIYSVLMNINPNLIEASRDLGAGPIRTFWNTTLPLSLPGVAAGFIFAFVLTAGEYITPALLGGTDGQMIANSIANQFGTLSNWPLGSAITFFVIGTIGAIFLAGAGLMRLLGIRR